MSESKWSRHQITVEARRELVCIRKRTHARTHAQNVELTYHRRSHPCSQASPSRVLSSPSRPRRSGAE